MHDTNYEYIIQAAKQTVRQQDGRNIIMRIFDSIIADPHVEKIELSDVLPAEIKNASEISEDVINGIARTAYIKYRYPDGKHELIYWGKKIDFSADGNCIIFPSDELRNIIIALIDRYGKNVILTVEKLNTVYAARLFFLLYNNGFMKSKNYSISFMDLKEALGLSASAYYETWSEFARKILNKSLAEINEASGTSYQAYIEDKKNKTVVFTEG